jgi:hypothetical protein
MATASVNLSLPTDERTVNYSFLKQEEWKQKPHR